MTNIREVKTKIKLTSNTLKITNAMNLISTSKYRKALSLLDTTKPYFLRILEVMKDAIQDIDSRDLVYFDVREKKKERKEVALVITSDKGLAGGYNINIIRFAEQNLKDNSFFVMIGKTGQKYFLDHHRPILESFYIRGKSPTVQDAEDIADFIHMQFLESRIDEISVIYTKLFSSVKMVPCLQKLLPLSSDIFERDEKTSKLKLSYNPSSNEIFSHLVPKYLSGVIYGALVESYASEQASRMQAMESASRNARDMLGDLSLQYNRARQQIITQEMNEIVSGSEALR